MSDGKEYGINHCRCLLSAPSPWSCVHYRVVRHEDLQILFSTFPLVFFAWSPPSITNLQNSRRVVGVFRHQRPEFSPVQLQHDIYRASVVTHANLLIVIDSYFVGTFKWLYGLKENQAELFMDRQTENTTVASFSCRVNSGKKFGSVKRSPLDMGELRWL